MLKPLEQFICDTCGEIINQPKDGWIEWISTGGKDGETHSFRIVHHFTTSPFAKPNNNGCYQHSKLNGAKDTHLDRFLNSDMKMAYILKFLDVGIFHNPEYRGTNITDMRNYVETVRRLTIPYYEEARTLWDVAQQDGFFSDDNELIIYSVSKLKSLIEKYGVK